jgi:hypothetical protein
VPVQLVDATPPVSQKFFLNRRFWVFRGSCRIKADFGPLLEA